MEIEVEDDEMEKNEQWKKNPKTVNKKIKKSSGVWYRYKDDEGNFIPSGKIPVAQLENY